jgi:hypothetical protein
MADEAKVEVAVPVVVEEKDALTLAQEHIAKVEAERDNYKNVALKRLGKLPGDAAFLDKDGKSELTVEEQVRLALLDKEVQDALRLKDEAAVKLAKENSELKLALKNQPKPALGGGGGGTDLEVKDNTFSEAQLNELRKTAARLKADPEKFIEAAKKKILARR